MTLSSPIFGSYLRFLRHRKGFACASFDWSYDSRCMDFLGRGGFLILGMRCTCLTETRLCLHTILQEHENAVNVLAPICSSWGMPARATSMRSFFNWQGHEGYDFVRSANVMVSRPIGLRHPDPPTEDGALVLGDPG